MSSFLNNFWHFCIQTVIKPSVLEIAERPMSSVTPNVLRRRHRTMHSNSRSRRHNNNNPITVEYEIPTQEMPTCIDLTSEIDLEEPETVIVDLTSVNDTSVVCLGNGVEDYRPVSSRTRRRSRSPHQSVEVVEDCPLTLEDPDLPVFDMRCVTSPRRSSQIEHPPISCPICLDSLREITRSSRQLMSTVCGHIFCNICITESVRAHRKCPKCRRRLTTKQIHPIFL